MDAELKSKWVEALRSGKYEQTRSLLRRDNSFCCLGVLCEVAGLKIDEDTGNSVVGVEWGDDDYDPIYKLLGSNEIAEQLWNRNDGLRGEREHSFAEIADYIEGSSL